MSESVKEKLLLQQIEVYKAKLSALRLELQYKNSYIETMEKSYADQLIKLHCKLSDYEGVTESVHDYLSREIVSDSWKIETMCKKLKEGSVLDLSRVKDPKRTTHMLESEWGRYRQTHKLPKLTIEKNYTIKMK